VKTNVHKDKRAWWLSHEAFLTLQELAHQQGLQTAAFLEFISRELALRRLSEEQRASIKAEAERIAAERRSAPITSGPSKSRSRTMPTGGFWITYQLYCCTRKCSLA